MTEQTSTLYAKLLGETAVISWAELQPFSPVAPCSRSMPRWTWWKSPRPLAGDDREKVAAWLSGGGLSKVGEDAAKDFLERDPTLWAVVVAPWVVIQERAEKATLH